MNPRNFQKELDTIITGLGQETAPTLLLHACCAPCSSYVLEYLSDYFEITLFFYNPNLNEKEEYERRKEEARRFVREFPAKHPIHFLEGTYEPEIYLTEVKGLEKEPEGGARCRKCFEMRLNESARICREKGLDYFTTTLTISPLKNAALLNEIGEKAAERYSVRFLPSDFKKRNGFLRSTELSKEYHLYRQDYCGCSFSRRERKRKKTE